MDKPILAPGVTCVLVLSTVADGETALRIARTLVDERLAACVQVLDGLRSVYRWQGRIDESAECQLVAKTTPQHAEALAERLRALHPYDLPEIVTLDGTASAAYGAWLRTETGG